MKNFLLGEAAECASFISHKVEPQGAWWVREIISGGLVKAPFTLGSMEEWHNGVIYLFLYRNMLLQPMTSWPMSHGRKGTCNLSFKSAAWLFGLECFVVPLFLQKMCRPIFHRLKERQDSGGFHAVYSCIHPGLPKEKSQGVANRKPVFCTDHFTGVQEFVSCVWMVNAFEVHELGHYHGCKWSKTKPWWMNHQSLQPQLWCKLISWKFANASVKGLWLGLSAIICVLSCSFLENAIAISQLLVSEMLSNICFEFTAPISVWANLDFRPPFSDQSGLLFPGWFTESI